jgi:hypothetical protein
VRFKNLKKKHFPCCKNAPAYYIAGVVAVNSEVLGLGPDVLLAQCFYVLGGKSSAEFKKFLKNIEA